MAGQTFYVDGRSYAEWLSIIKACGLFKAHCAVRDELKGRFSVVDAKKLACKPFNLDGTINRVELATLGWMLDDDGNIAKVEVGGDAGGEGGDDGDDVAGAVALPNVGAGRSGKREAVTREQYRKLIADGVWRENVPERDAIKWVLEHLTVQDMRPEDAPCGLAWSQYAFFSRNEGRQADYFKDFGSKFIPTRSQLEVEGKFTDSGEELEGFIEEQILAFGREAGRV